MGEKCRIKETGRDIDTCQFMDSVCYNNYGGFERALKSVRLISGERLTRVAIIVKKSAKNAVELNYCPFCGCDIDTSDYGIKEHSHG
ncbi:hypothetical protein I5730_12810 [Acinetobacter nosocomialis]|uniref:hypothetical protein n=1 Tax=Acinetobacter nosocomialis TaxID=106654 RepID=UPI001900FEAD|nr:hypothetical protein [Acinetobacter nosocomialis]MBJ9961426.1 hypothetical protein [Acinetobacter nosocomialis]HAV5468672.1 hypothetical protein [Acinetobacter baumannii]